MQVPIILAVLNDMLSSQGITQPTEYYLEVVTQEVYKRRSAQNKTLGGFAVKGGIEIAEHGLLKAANCLLSRAPLG